MSFLTLEFVILFLPRREIAASLNDFSNRWCKRENYEWKINIFKIIDRRISFISRNTHLLPPKPKSSFRHQTRYPGFSYELCFGSSR